MTKLLSPDAFCRLHNAAKSTWARACHGGTYPCGRAIQSIPHSWWERRAASTKNLPRLSAIQASSFSPSILVVSTCCLNLRRPVNYQTLSTRKLQNMQLCCNYVSTLPGKPLNYTVSQKTKQIYFCQNFVKFAPILIIFGRKMGNDPNICEVHSFSTSPNLRHHLTVLNANVPNCYITPNVVICNKLLTI